MNEAQTRFNKIDPKLRDAGWGIVPGSNILVEQSAYIAPGRITTTGHKNPKKADYILEYKGIKLAVIEAKSDVTIAKNYLSEQEVESLNLLTTAFIDTAEDRARRHLIMKMADWKLLLERYLNFQERDILPDAGSVTHEEAEAKALGEYEKFWRIQDQTFLSDFDKLLEDLA